MRTWTATAFAAVLLLGMSTASITLAQSGKTKDARDTISWDEGEDIMETFWMFLGGRGKSGPAWWAPEKEKQEQSERHRQWERYAVPRLRDDDPSASGGGD